MDSELSSFGLVLVENFITEEEEISLLAMLPKSKQSPQKKTRNNIWRYGEKRVYTDGHIGGPPPPLLVTLAQRLVEKLDFPAAPQCFTVNEYHKGQVIKPHTDQLACGPVITVLSLRSSATMRLTGGHKEYAVELLPRSLVLMTGVVRTSWLHSIDPVADTRYSVVFRR
jgi:alkylated DNA repair dioxygenase AlkB